MSQSEGEVGGKSNAFYNLFTVQNRKIVGHWDVLQIITHQSKNDNGLF